MDDAEWLGDILLSLFPAEAMFSVSETTGRIRVEWTVPEIDRRNVPLVIALDSRVRRQWERETVVDRIALEGKMRRLISHQLDGYDEAGSVAIPEAVVLRIDEIDI